MKITFLGGAGGVTGANHLLEIRKTKLIIDCGLFQSEEYVDKLNYQNFAYDPSTLPYALITHAHLDHVGRLPRLYRAGFRGKIFATAPTMELARLILEDSCAILENETKKNQEKPFICTPDIPKVMKLFQPVSYYEKIKLASNITAEFRDAGHILGSSIIAITDHKEKKTIVFNGDMGNVDKPILRDPTPVEQADYVVTESVYGDRNHENQASKKIILAKIFLENIKKKGTLMIPSFSLERTQELLYYFNSLIEKHKFQPIPIFLDSPLAIKITRVFKKFPEYFDEEAQGLIASGDDFLHFPGLQITETADESKKIARVPGPKIIIAGSGMMHAGRILHHLPLYLPNKNNTLLIIGFQVRGSLGRKLLDGEKQVRIWGSDVKVAATVKALGAMSAHADSDHLYEWVRNIKGLKKAFVVQGDPESADALSKRIAKGLRIPALAPGLGYSEEL